MGSFSTKIFVAAFMSGGDERSDEGVNQNLVLYVVRCATDFVASLDKIHVYILIPKSQ